MASNCARNLARRSTTTAKTVFSRFQSSRPVETGPAKLSGLSSPRLRPSFSRLPVELGCCGESMMPLHSATASALLKSMLSSKVGHWGVLSEATAKETRPFSKYMFKRFGCREFPSPRTRKMITPDQVPLITPIPVSHAVMHHMLSIELWKDESLASSFLHLVRPVAGKVLQPHYNEGLFKSSDIEAMEGTIAGHSVLCFFTHKITVMLKVDYDHLYKTHDTNISPFDYVKLKEYIIYRHSPPFSSCTDIPSKFQICSCLDLFEPF